MLEWPGCGEYPHIFPEPSRMHRNLEVIEDSSLSETLWYHESPLARNVVAVQSKLPASL